MRTDRRAFLGMAVSAARLWLAHALSPQVKFPPPQGTGPGSLPPPITRAERMQRIAKAQQLMRAAGLKALLVEAGSSLVYFTGVQWWRRERLTAALIPADGEPVLVTPAFEEPSVRENLQVPADVRVWNEHESPFALLADWLKAHGAGKGPVGVEETTRFFVFDGLRQLGVETRGDSGVGRTCRMIKSPAEIALMQAAADITIAAYRETGPQIARGMTPADIAGIMSAAMKKHGGDPGFTLVLLGEAAAYPHGTGKPQEVKPGEIVLMDCGCSVEGYQSDISRTMVMGEATSTSAKSGISCIAASRSHSRLRRSEHLPARSTTRCARLREARLRSGLQAAGHVASNRSRHRHGCPRARQLRARRNDAAGAGHVLLRRARIYIPGSFGVRLEDCIHVTESGPKWFSVPPPSIDKPFG